MEFKEIIEQFNMIRKGLENGCVEYKMPNNKTPKEVADRFYEIYKDFECPEKQTPGCEDLENLHDLAVGIMSFMFYHSVQALTRPMGFLFIFVVQLESTHTPESCPSKTNNK